jgi:hypothetical protein
MARFDSAIALAKRLITKNGQVVTLRNFIQVAGGPDTPWKPGGATPVDQKIETVFLDYEQKYIDGELIRSGDQKVYMPAQGLTSAPERDGQVLRGNEVWKIITIKPLSPNGQQIMYEIQVRQ